MVMAARAPLRRGDAGDQRGLLDEFQALQDGNGGFHLADGYRRHTVDMEEMEDDREGTGRRHDASCPRSAVPEEDWTNAVRSGESRALIMTITRTWSTPQDRRRSPGDR